MLTTSAKKEDFNKAVKQLNDLANVTGLAYLSAGPSRKIFFDEINAFINSVTREIDIQCMSVQGGTKIIQEEISHLQNQHFQLMTGKIVQYAAIEKTSPIGRYVNLMVKQVGFVGGGTQVVAGFGVCAASIGTACAAFGAPLIAHGANNFYENGYYLLFRKEKSGYTRKGYHKVARKLGYSQNDADFAYASVDLALSGYGLGRMVLKPDAFRLIRYINSDYIRGWKEMGKVSLGFEALSDGATIWGIHQLRKDNK